MFPPTDFHTATLVGDAIYIIGNLGYQDARIPGETPVFRLDTRTLATERLDTTGEKPGWISRHRARVGEGEIVISKGEVNTADGYIDNTDTFALDLRTLRWRRC